MPEKEKEKEKGENEKHIRAKAREEGRKKRSGETNERTNERK